MQPDYSSKEWQEYLSYIDAKYGKIPTIQEYFKITDEIKEWS